jgi:hypothetical protein
MARIDSDNKLLQYHHKEIEESRQRAEPVWPPSVQDNTPVGLKRARAFASTRISISEEDSPDFLEEITGTIAKLPVCFFLPFEDGRRNVRFFISSLVGSDGISSSSMRPLGPPSDRKYLVFLCGDYQSLAIEIQDALALGLQKADPLAACGILVHELCHAILDHPLPTSLDVEDTSERDDAIQRLDNEALSLACWIGFKAETIAFLQRLPEFEYPQTKSDALLSWISEGCKGSGPVFGSGN